MVEHASCTVYHPPRGCPGRLHRDGLTGAGMRPVGPHHCLLSPRRRRLSLGDWDGLVNDNVDQGCVDGSLTLAAIAGYKQHMQLLPLYGHAICFYRACTRLRLIRRLRFEHRLAGIFAAAALHVLYRRRRADACASGAHADSADEQRVWCRRWFAYNGRRSSATRPRGTVYRGVDTGLSGMNVLRLPLPRGFMTRAVGYLPFTTPHTPAHTHPHTTLPPPHFPAARCFRCVIYLPSFSRCPPLLLQRAAFTLLRARCFTTPPPCRGGYRLLRRIS
jgi:hypothetical protein